MSLKLLGAALAALISVPAAPALSPISDEPPIEYRAITMIECGTSRGTGFWIDDTRILTAAHVTRQGPCSINGAPLAVVREDNALDIAELSGPANPFTLDLDCRGLREGQVYFAVGWAQGQFRHTSRLLATGQLALNNLTVLMGNVYNGQSGGPNIGRSNGKVAGITSMRNTQLPFALNRSVANTWLCER